MTFRYDPFEQTDDGYVVLADLPGFEKDDINVSYDDGVLTIEGETAVTGERGPVSHHRSRTVHERLSIPGDVRVEKSTATYHNGVLEITLPVEEPSADTHHIDID